MLVQDYSSGVGPSSRETGSLLGEWSSHSGCWGEDGNDLSCFNVSTDLGRFVLSFGETPTYGGNGAVTAPYHAINIAGTCEKLLISSLSAHIGRRLSTRALGGART